MTESHEETVTETHTTVEPAHMPDPAEEKRVDTTPVEKTTTETTTVERG